MLTFVDSKSCVGHGRQNLLSFKDVNVPETQRQCEWRLLDKDIRIDKLQTVPNIKLTKVCTSKHSRSSYFLGHAI